MIVGVCLSPDNLMFSIENSEDDVINFISLARSGDRAVVCHHAVLNWRSDSLQRLRAAVSQPATPALLAGGEFEVTRAAWGRWAEASAAARPAPTAGQPCL